MMISFKFLLTVLLLKAAVSVALMSHSMKYVLMESGKVPTSGVTFVGSVLSCSAIRCAGVCTELRSQCRGFVFQSTTSNMAATGSCQPVSFGCPNDVILGPAASGQRFYVTGQCSDDNFPCQNSATCVSAQWPNVKCLCNLDYGGVYCEKRCPSGYAYQSSTGSCYRLEVNIMTWNESAIRCASDKDGAHLVFIESSVEQLLIKSLVNGSMASQWIGGQRINATSLYSFVWTTNWSNGSVTYKPVVYTDWYPGEPNILAQKCVLCGVTNNYQWRDATCFDTAASVCEFEL